MKRILMFLVAMVLLLAACHTAPKDAAPERDGDPAIVEPPVQVVNEAPETVETAPPIVELPEQGNVYVTAPTLARIEIVTPPIYYGVRHFSEGFAVVYTRGYPNTRVSLVDRNGNHVTPQDRFESMEDFRYGVATARIAGGGWVLLDEHGNETPLPYEQVWWFSEGVTIVSTGGRRGVIDTRGNEIVPLGQFDNINSFSEGMTPVRDRQTGLYGFIDTSGQLVIPAIYERAYSFENGFAVVSGPDGAGVIDIQGREVLPIQFEQIGQYGDGLFPVQLDGLMGFANTSGEVVIPPTFEMKWMHPFSHGLALVNIDGRSGFIDTAGNIAIPPIFHAVTDGQNRFIDGVMQMWLDNSQVLIDTEGNQLAIGGNSPGHGFRIWEGGGEVLCRYIVMV